MASRLRDFNSMNPPIFFAYNVNKYPQDFLNEVYKILFIMALSSNAKEELAAYQLNDVAQTWYTQWKDNRTLRSGSISWEVFRRALLYMFFPREKREAEVEEFIKLRQRGMSVQKYTLKFIKLSKYALSLVSYSSD